MWSIEAPNLDALGWALIHFLWQGALIGLIASALLLALRSRSSNLRCLVASTAMAACLATFIVTVLVLSDSSHIMPEKTVVAGSSVGQTTKAGPGQQAVPLDQGSEMTTLAGVGLPTEEMPATTLTLNATTMQIVAIIWLFGILLMTARFNRQYLGTRRLRRSGVSDPDPGSARLFTKIRKSLGIDPAVRLFQSTLAETPMVVGWLRPVVLMPVSVLSSLDEEELTLVFLHELTHIRRQDHLLNLIQSIVEIVLFYHPIVWWLSRQIRVEREHCCDDTMLRQGTEPGRLARTLFKLESMRVERADTTPIVLTASGGNFMNRIKRIVETPSPTRVLTFGRTPLALTLGSLLVALSIANIDSVDASVTSPIVQERDRGEERGQKRDERRGERVDAPDLGDIEEAMESAGMALEKGKISPDQFRKIMASLEDASMERDPVRRRVMVADAMRFYDIKDGDDVRIGMPVGDDVIANRVGMMMIELGMAVDSGDMSPEDAIRKVMDLARRMRVDTTPEHAPADQRRARAAYAEAAEKMRERVKAGEITQEQMDERLEQMKRRMAMAGEGERKSSMTKADYAEAVEKMTAMVKAGEITREQMQQRLDEMRRRMTGDADSKQGMSKAEYDKAVAEMVEMVKAGKMTREQMQKRLDGMNKAMKDKSMKDKAMKDKATKDDRSKLQFSKAEVEAAYEKMQKMVESGEITRKQMEQRLGEMKGMMADVSESERKMKLEYERAVEKMTEMVKNGKMTRKQMQERLERMRKEMSSDR